MAGDTIVVIADAPSDTPLARRACRRIAGRNLRDIARHITNYAHFSAVGGT